MSERTEELWRLYQKARSDRAEAEVMLVKARLAAERSENAYGDLMNKEVAARERWWAAMEAARAAASQPEGTVQ